MATPQREAAAPGRGERVFFALWPSEATARRLHDAARSVQDGHGGRAMRCETLHLTLAFIGEVSRERGSELIAIGEGTEFEPHALRLDQLGCWRHNRLAWAGSSAVPEALSEMVATLHARLGQAGFALEKRPFAPHVTLVRRIARSFPVHPIEPIDWPVAGFRLVASERRADGAYYRSLAQWPAGRAP